MEDIWLACGITTRTPPACPRRTSRARRWACRPRRHRHHLRRLAGSSGRTFWF
jgi:hypothetical protein